MRKKEIYQKHILRNTFLALLIITLFFGFYFLNKNYNNNLLKNIGYTVYKPINKFTSSIKEIKNYKKISELNLKLEKLELNNQFLSNYNQFLEKENESLKQLETLEKELPNYEIKYAKVIQRNEMYWFNEITIDKGSKDKIKINQAVIGKNGLIGRVKQTSKNYSVIELITNEKVKTSIYVKGKKGEKVGLINKYQDNHLIAEGITNYDNVEIGDKVYTTGLGNLPKGILIGEIEKVEENNYGTSNIIYIKGSPDIENLSLVGVLFEKWYLP